MGLIINYEDIFTELGLNQQSNMTYEYFVNLLLRIDKQLYTGDIQFFFKFFDAKNQGVVEFKAFYDWLVKNNIKI